MKFVKTRWLLIFLAIFSLLSGSYGFSADEFFSCVPDDKLEKEIAPEASLEKLQCLFKNYEGAQTLHVEVTIVNKSDKPQRFRINFFLDNGKAAGGLLPEKIKDGLVQPGASITYAYPIVGMTEKPGSAIIKIRAIETE